MRIKILFSKYLAFACLRNRNIIVWNARSNWELVLLGDFNAHVIRQVGVGISANFVQFFACFDYRESSISADLFWEKWELHCSKKPQ